MSKLISLPRPGALTTSLFVQLIATVASMVLDKHFWCYGEFTASAVACIGYLVGNKFINSKYNTPLGEAGKPLGGERKC